MMRVVAFILLCLLLTGPLAHACRVCRPRVQAGIHTPDYTANLLLLLLPVALLLLTGLGVYFASSLTARLPFRSAHD